MINKIKNKIKDIGDVRKYRKKANTAINKYHARNEEYIESLETISLIVKQNLELQNQIKKLKDEKKELKRIIEEEMQPKKKRSK